MPFDCFRFARWAAPLSAALMACAFEVPVVPREEPPVVVDEPPITDDEPPTEDDEPTVTAEDALDAWLRAACAPAVRCGWMEKVEDCMPIATQDAANNGIDGIAAGVKVDGVALDERALARCIAAIEARDCDEMMGFQFSAFSECRDLLVGSQPVDAACASAFSCAPGLYCRKQAKTECGGTCHPIVGGQCVNDDDCESDRICHEFRCQSPVRPLRQLGIGDSCARRYDIGACGPGAKCRDDRCVAVRGEGEACAGASSCGPRDTSHNCLIKRAGDCGPSLTRLVCDPAESRCIRAPDSGPCAGGEFCDAFESWCDTTLEPPTCVPHREAGAACESHMECGAPSPAGLCLEEGGVCWRREVLACR